MLLAFTIIMIAVQITITGFKSCKFLFARGESLNLVHVYLFVTYYYLKSIQDSAILPAVVFSVILEFDIPTNCHSEHG